MINHRLTGRLDLPGGRSDGTESAQCTAHRETWEETGLDVAVGKLLLEFENSLLYECTVPETAFRDTTESTSLLARLEVTEVTWANLHELSPRRWRYRGQLRQLRRVLDERRGAGGE